MIGVIGAGPVGSYLSGMLAKNGKKVTLYEEHKDIGTPVQCTGILTGDIKDLIRIPNKAIANKIKKIEVISPDNTILSLKLKSPEIIVYRTLFDQLISGRAEKEGVIIKKGHRFQSFIGRSVLFRTEEGIKKISHSEVIGADGALSRVAKETGLMKNRKYYSAMQITVKGSFDNTTYKTFLGKDYPGFFGWIVPEDEETARVGIGSRKNPAEYFKKFLKKEIGEDYEKRTISHQNGLIPIYSPFHKIRKGNITIIGDAAGHVKATTGGGIIPGMKIARSLAENINEGKQMSFTPWKHGGKELLTHLVIRNILDRLDDKDYDSLIRRASKKGIKKILETTSREQPGKIIAGAIRKDPGLFLFSKILFQKKKT